MTLDPHNMKPGQLLVYRCWNGDKCLGAWEAISHGGGKFHSIKRRKKGCFELAPPMPNDRVTKVRFGLRIDRALSE